MKPATVQSGKVIHLVTCRLDDRTYRAVKAVAAAAERPTSWVLRQLVLRGLETKRGEAR